MNFAFYISGTGKRLSNILEWNLEVISKTKLVITDSKDTLYLKDKFKKLNIPFLFFDYNSYKVKNEDTNLKLSNFILKKFKEHKIDYCFCFGDHILKGNLLEEYKNKIINFHPSILPMFPGRLSIDKALQSQSILLGNTAHYVDSGVDTGNIIEQIIFSKDVFNSIGYEGVLNFQIKMLMNIFAYISHENYDVDLLESKLPKIKTFNTRAYELDL